VYVIGIDAGVNGGIAMLYHDGSNTHIVRHDPVPTYWHKLSTKSKGGKVRRRKAVDYTGLVDLYHEYAKYTSVVYIEKVHSMPNQSSSSMFVFGEAYGALQAMNSAFFGPNNYVTPQKWKKALGLNHAEKKEAITLVNRLFSENIKLTNHNEADAILIAWYGLQIQLQKKEA